MAQDNLRSEIEKIINYLTPEVAGMNEDATDKIMGLIKFDRKMIIMALTEMFDEMESKDIDQSTEKWMEYKMIRNSIRDWAQGHGIDIKERNDQE